MEAYPYELYPVIVFFGVSTVFLLLFFPRVATGLHSRSHRQTDPQIYIVFFMATLVMTRLIVSLIATFVTFVRVEVTLAAATLRNNHDHEHQNDGDDVPPSATDYTLQAQKDQILELPGLDYDPGFHQFSGYLTVDESHGRNIHYWYVESQGDPANDPVVFWTNGGPGCSGLLGFGTEHGPFYISKEGNLRPNPYSWNQVASILYVEQPAGVGFSYSDTEEDYKTGDSKAAIDNYELIQQFLLRYPERRANEFYISSESYGGHYIPQLTKEILERNTGKLINFKGFLVGNPFVDYWSNMVTQYAAYYSHGLLAKPLYERWVSHCADQEDHDDDEICDQYLDDMTEAMNHGINPYALDFPACLEGGETVHSQQQYYEEQTYLKSPQHEHQKKTVAAAAKSMLALHSHSSQSARLLLQQQQQQQATNPPFLPKQDHYYPCAENHLLNYLNRTDVKVALHVKEDRNWESCSDEVDYNMGDLLTPQMDLYKELLSIASTSEDLNMLVFSGDDDSICSTAGTQYWIYDLGVDPLEGHLWQPWEVNGQTAGFVTHFDLSKRGKGRHGHDGSTSSSFVFATVHGAGHEVPAYRPLEALELFKKYLSGEW